MADGVLEMLPKLRIRQAGNMNFAYLGQINRTGAVDRDLGIEIDLSPYANQQLIAGAEDVVGSDIDVAQRGKGRRYLAKELSPYTGSSLPTEPRTITGTL